MSQEPRTQSIERALEKAKTQLADAINTSNQDWSLIDQLEDWVHDLNSELNPPSQPLYSR